MSEPVMIGIREVYDAVKELKTNFDLFAKTTAIDVALLKADVDNLKREREAEKTRRWQVYVALIGAVVAVAIAIIK